MALLFLIVRFSIRAGETPQKNQKKIGTTPLCQVSGSQEEEDKERETERKEGRKERRKEEGKSRGGEAREER